MKKGKLNLDIRIKMMVNDIPCVEVAKVLGIQPSNFSHLLNDKPLSDEWHNAIMDGIDAVIIRQALTKREVTT